jgi:hypothetical protein
MPTVSAPAPSATNLFVDLMDALSNHHGQMDVRFERLNLRLPFAGRTLELNGNVSVSVHLRDLSDKERSAHVAKQLRALG